MKNRTPPMTTAMRPPVSPRRRHRRKRSGAINALRRTAESNASACRSQVALCLPGLPAASPRPEPTRQTDENTHPSSNWPLILRLRPRPLGDPPLTTENQENKNGKYAKYSHEEGYLSLGDVH